MTDPTSDITGRSGSEVTPIDDDERGWTGCTAILVICLVMLALIGYIVAWALGY